MTKKLTYDMLSDEDKLLIDELILFKDQRVIDRKIIRDIIAQLRKMEMGFTTEIMNLSVKKIGEKFDLGHNSAKKLSKKERARIKSVAEEPKKLHPSVIQKRIMDRINEKKICSQNGHQSTGNSRSIEGDSRRYCRN